MKRNKRPPAGVRSCQLAGHDQPDSKPYTLSSEVIRLTNAISCGLKYLDAPEDVL